MKMKKNLAIVMSAVTAVGAVAPVVANAAITEKTVSRDEAIKAVKEALATKYDGKNEFGGDNAAAVDKEVRRSVYTIYRVHKDADGKYVQDERITDEKQVQSLADNGAEFTIKIKDKGHIKDGNKIKSERETKNQVYAKTGDDTATELVGGKIPMHDATSAKVMGVTFRDALVNGDATTKLVLENAVNDFVVYDADGENPKSFKYEQLNTQQFTDAVNSAYKVVLVLKHGEKVEMTLHGDRYDFTQPMDAANDELNRDNKLLNTPKDDVWGQVAKFKMVPVSEDDEDLTQTVTVVGADTKYFEVGRIARTLNYKVEDYYSAENGYNDAGADLVNSLRRLAKKVNNNWQVANVGGVNYKATQELPKASTKVEYVDGQYELKLKYVDVTDTVDSQAGNKIKYNIDVIFRGKSLAEVNKIRDDIFGDVDVVPGKFDKIIGKNRFATALEVSKERFENKNSAESVVIVGANAITDGLAAAPLASAKKAPVLLAGKGKLDSATIEEIKRVTDDIKNKTVYIVGGKSSVSEEVDAQLKKEFGAVVVRLSGSDRYATSVEVAKRLYDDGDINTNSRMFFTGGTGAADAMSVSAVAASKVKIKADKTGYEGTTVSPIIIMKKDGFDRDTRRTLGMFANNKGQVYVVGGTGTVSYDGIQEVNKVLGLNKNASAVRQYAKRLSGVNRYATNADVVKEFYTINTPISLGNYELKAQPRVFVASAMDNFLVDAQTSGALAAEQKVGTRNVPAPILLVGNKLDKSQADLFVDKAKENKDNVFAKEEAVKFRNNGSEKLSGTKLTQVGGAASASALREIVKALGL